MIQIKLMKDSHMILIVSIFNRNERIIFTGFTCYFFEKILISVVWKLSKIA